MFENINFNCVPASQPPFGCIELYAGNERVHNHVSLPGLEGDVISLPYKGSEGGDLYALFSCGDRRYARVVLADVSGHGVSASGVANHVHRLLHQFSDVRDTAGLLEALNETFFLGESRDGPLRLSTVVTATFEVETGEFNYAYAAHPRMIHWTAREGLWSPLGAGPEGLPVGAIGGG